MNVKMQKEIIQGISFIYLYYNNPKKSIQALGQTVKPIENARYEAYQMRVQGRNYNTNAAENTNANHALESMLRPEVRTLLCSRTLIFFLTILHARDFRKIALFIHIIYLHIIFCIHCP